MKLIVWQARTDSIILSVAVPKQRVTDLIGFLEERMCELLETELEVYRSSVGTLTATFTLPGGGSFEHFKFEITYNENLIS